MNANIEVSPAQVALDALTSALGKADNAALTSIHNRYGKDVDVSAVKLAQSAARQLAGLAKPGQGGSAQRVNNTVKAARELDALTDKALVQCARVVLDAHNEAMKAARDAKNAARKADSETRAAAKSVLNDRSAKKADRIAALEVMAEIDGKSDRDKSAATLDAFKSAVLKFQAAGFGVNAALETISAVYGESAVYGPLVVAMESAAELAA